MTPTIPISYYLYVATILFAIGAVGVLIRRNAIVAFMGIELMLNASNLAFITFARQHGDQAGHIYVFIIMAIAAAEVAVGLGIIIAVFRERRVINVDEIRDMQG